MFIGYQLSGSRNHPVGGDRVDFKSIHIRRPSSENHSGLQTRRSKAVVLKCKGSTYLYILSHFANGALALFTLLFSRHSYLFGGVAGEGYHVIVNITW